MLQLRWGPQSERLKGLVVRQWNTETNPGVIRVTRPPLSAPLKLNVSSERQLIHRQRCVHVTQGPEQRKTTQHMNVTTRRLQRVFPTRRRAASPLNELVRSAAASETLIFIGLEQSPYPERQRSYPRKKRQVVSGTAGLVHPPLHVATFQSLLLSLLPVSRPPRSFCSSR